MTECQTGRMLAGSGILIGPPPNQLFDIVVEFLKTHLPLLPASLLNTNIDNENGLNSLISRFITNAADQEMFFAERECMEDETRGDSAATDIGIYLKVEDCGIDPPMITAFESKRLTMGLPKLRRREYVIGHVKDGKYVQCGGIERFKKSIHGDKFTHAGMFGYVQDGTAEHWLDQVNAWIVELSSHEHDPAWTDQEQLTQMSTGGLVTESSSVVYRKTGKLYLTHLWINLVPQH